jgi:hypothetical protein
MDFIKFPKIPRLSRGCVITEKIDGTNAQIVIDENGELYTGSRNRWITPENDNYGFAKWALEHKAELLQLGPGRHFGEWWGQGIQRKYNLKEKVFSLFNVNKWTAFYEEGKTQVPECCGVVPILSEGMFSDDLIEKTLELLIKNGSYAAPGFMNPEGIVIYHLAAGTYFKKTIENDEAPKSLS